MYKVTADMFPELQKKIRAIEKKLDKYNLNHEFKTMEPVIEKIKVYAIDDVTGIRRQVGEKLVEVIPYTFWMEILKIGKWIPVAKIEHDALIINGSLVKNMVHRLNEGIHIDQNIETSWSYIKSYCDHCMSNRQRKVTIILISENDGFKQVGSSCIKEFTGIDAYDIISLYSNINDIYLEEAYEISNSGIPKPGGYVPTVDYLANAIQVIKKDGEYKQDITRISAFRISQTEKPSMEYIDEANEIISYFRETDLEILPFWEQSFYKNVRDAFENQYTKCNGLIAYAPVAYQKLREAIQKAQEEAIELSQRSQSTWQGNIGDKISIDVTLERSIGYEGEWGYSYFHIFKDAQGNIYKWSTGSSLYNKKSDGTLTGTIKGHDEYEGVKQTAVTRCKIT